MSRFLIGLLATAALPALTATIAGAQDAARLYPYCSVSTSTGGSNCYISSREQCGSNCISNPWYIGNERAQADVGAHKTRAVRRQRADK